MELFDVYPLFDVEPVKAKGTTLWDKEGKTYLDLYGGHAVISIGHGHPKYIKRITAQLEKIGFYSNAIINDLQKQYADRLAHLSGLEDYSLFLCSSGAEAIENALKVASFDTGRKKVIAMKGAFHGRTSGAVAITDNAKIVSPFNQGHLVQFTELNDLQGLEDCMSDEVAAVIIEGCQGVAGIFEPTEEFLLKARALCDAYGAKLILDEVQSGFGRTGKFFAFQHASVEPDIITMAKGMGNGFPLAGLLIREGIQPWHGMLGTTFGGNHLACAAGLAVLEVLEEEQLIEHAAQLGKWLINELSALQGIQQVRGKGLMLGVDMGRPVKHLRGNLLTKHRIFTGSAADPNTLRLLPPLCIEKEELYSFLNALKKELS